MPTFGSLFAGIGGIDLGLERAGWTCRWQVEWDAYCQRVLAKHWPDVPRYGDITAVDWSGVERVDLLAGGFPCQPVSSAGRQAAQDDPRWLWPEFLRAVRALRPRLVLVENVPNLMAVNDGTAFGDVLGDLAASGYDAEWDCIPAAFVGAPHERDRVWVVAYPNSDGLGGLGFDRLRPHADALAGDHADGRGGPPALAYSHGARLEGRGGARGEVGQGADERAPRTSDPLPDADRERWIGRAGEPRPGWWREPSDGRWWSSEPDVGRVAHGVPARVDRLRALGNAVVPQVVEVIGERLMASLAEREAE